MGGGCELIGEDFGTDPSYIEFTASQFERFNVPLTQKFAEELLTIAANATVYTLGSACAEMMFLGITDVELTEDWCHYTYQLKDGNSRFELDPASLNTFRFVPGGDQEHFNDALSKPGLDALMYDLGESLRDSLWSYGDHDIADALSAEAYDDLERLCLMEGPDGKVYIDKERQLAYFDLALWAACLWALGPLGKNWRWSSHEIFAVCYDQGSAIMFEGMLYSPESFVQIEREAHSCHICGVSAWCVEITQDGDVTTKICESCLNSGLGGDNPYVCGTKACHHVSCPNHKQHTTDKDGFWRAMGGRGRMNGLGGNTARSTNTDLLS